MEKTSKKAVETSKAGLSAIGRYFEGIGRRKTSVARARLYSAKVPARNASHSDAGGKAGDIEITVNEKPYKSYFPTIELQKIAEDALVKSSNAGLYKVTAHVNGGGINSQAEALRHGIARALLLIDPELRKNLKQEGYLKRDPRAKERRKFGLKKARKAPQWAKR